MLKKNNKKTKLDKINSSIDTQKKKSKLNMDMSEMKTSTKIGIIVASSAVAIIGVGYGMMSMFDDEVKEGNQDEGYYSGYEQTYDEGDSWDDPNLADPYEGILGEEATYGEEEDPLEEPIGKPKPWFAMTLEDLEEEPFVRKINKSAKGQHTTIKIINLINKQAAKDVVVATKADPKDETTSDLIQSIIDGMDIPTGGLSSEDLIVGNGTTVVLPNSPSSGGNSGGGGSGNVILDKGGNVTGNNVSTSTGKDTGTGISNDSLDTYYKDLFEKLTKAIVDSGLGEMVDPDNGFNFNINGDKKDVVDTIGKVTVNDSKGNINKIDDIITQPTLDKTKLVVQAGDANQFTPLSQFEDSYYLRTPKGTTIASYLNSVSRSYKGQLDVDSLDYSLVKGTTDLYEVEVKYLVTKKEYDTLKRAARQFAETNKNKSDDEFIKSLADYIANITTYGNSSNKYSAYSLYEGKEVVCQAYASFAKIVLDARGLNNTLLTGTSNNEPHVWTVIKLNGVEYEYDFTHYDTSGRNTQFLKAKAGTLPNRTYEYIVE